MSAGICPERVAAFEPRGLASEPGRALRRIDRLFEHFKDVGTAVVERAVILELLELDGPPHEGKAVRQHAGCLAGELHRKLIYTGAIDRALDKHGPIRPGLGYAGDRLFGTK